MTSDGRDRLREELRKDNEQLDAEIAAKIAEILPGLDQLAEATAKAGDPDSAAELRRMMERLIETAGRK